MRRIAGPLLYCALTLLATASEAPALPADYTVTPIVEGPGGSTPMINASGDVLFWAGSAGSDGLYLWSAGSVTPLVETGDPAPGTGGGTFGILSCISRSFDGLGFSNTGQVSYVAGIQGGTAALGVFVSDQSGTRLVVLEGDAAPGGGVYDLYRECGPLKTSVNSDGHVAFQSFKPYLGSSAVDGIFLDVGGVQSAVVLDGQPAPGGEASGSSFSSVASTMLARSPSRATAASMGSSSLPAAG